MARSLGIETVAEGIETAAQAERMTALSCTYGQGYFYAMPLLPEEIPAPLARWPSRSPKRPPRAWRTIPRPRRTRHPHAAARAGARPVEAPVIP